MFAYGWYKQESDPRLAVSSSYAIEREGPLTARRTLQHKTSQEEGKRKEKKRKGKRGHFATAVRLRGSGVVFDRITRPGHRILFFSAVPTKNESVLGCSECRGLHGLPGFKYIAILRLAVSRRRSRPQLRWHAHPPAGLPDNHAMDSSQDQVHPSRREPLDASTTRLRDAAVHHHPHLGALRQLLQRRAHAN